MLTVHTDKSKVEISQNFVAFSEYMNFKMPCNNIAGHTPGPKAGAAPILIMGSVIGLMYFHYIMVFS